MIFYKNLKKHKKTSQKDIVFSIFANGVVSNQDDLISKPNECKEFYNLSVSDGSLKTGLGFRDLQVPASADDLETCHGFDFAEKIDEIDGIWLDRWYNTDVEMYIYTLLMIDSEFVIWGVPLIDQYEGIVWSKSNKLTSYPTYECQYRIENTDCTLFFSEEGMLYLAAYGEGIYPDVPALISGVVHYDNFFGITNTNRNTLIYTTNLNLKEWSDEESSAIEFLDNRGSFNKLVAFNDYVYLFREYGITKISIYTSKDDFSFTHLYTSSSKIYENSVCVCGDKVFFMTRDGLYTFNGTSVNKVAEVYDKYFKKLDNTNCSSACLNGKYYIATKCNFDDGEQIGCEGKTAFVNNVLFEVDIENFDLNVYRGVDIRKILTVDNPYMSKLCACFYYDHKQQIGELTVDGKTFTDINKKMWKSFETDLDYKSKKKKIKEIIINTLYDCEVEIKSDEETKTYSFSGSEKEQRLPVCVYGKNFQFSFSTTAQNCEICKPMIVFDVVS